MTAPPDPLRLRSRLLQALFAASLGVAPAVFAADLGPIMVTSPAGEALQATLLLSLGVDESPEAIQVSVGSPAEYGWLEIDRPAWVDDVDLGVTSEEGQTVVRLWTPEPPPEPRFSLLVVVASPTGRSLRQYDVVLRDAEVLQTPATRQAEAPADLDAARPGGERTEVEPPPSAEQPTPEPPLAVSRPSRRPTQVPERGELAVRRNLSISPAIVRSPAGSDRRAQRLEEGMAAQRRALEEANSRIGDLQSQVEKLQQLMALKGLTPPADKPTDKPAAEAGKAESGKAGAAPKPAGEGGTPTPAAATPAPEPGKPAAVAKPDAASAAGATPAAENPAAATDGAQSAAPEGQPAVPADGTGPAVPTVEETPAEKPAAPEQPKPATEEEDLTGLLMTVGAVVLGLAVATAGALWWRRRRARHAILAESMAAAAVTVPDEMVPVEAAQPAEVDIDPAEFAVAAGAVEESFAAALDEPLGDAGAASALPDPATTPVASLQAVTAEPDTPPDDLDAMFSEQAIAAAQVAIRAGAAGPVTAADTGMPDLEAQLANAESAPADAALVQTPSTDTQPAAVEAPATDAGADTEEDAVDDAADLEDVEVNLAKAYLDMGDPDGARAILEGMLNDPDNAGRAALARRTMRRFGLQPSLPPAAEPEA